MYLQLIWLMWSINICYPANFCEDWMQIMDLANLTQKISQFLTLTFNTLSPL